MRLCGIHLLARASVAFSRSLCEVVVFHLPLLKCNADSLYLCRVDHSGAFVRYRDVGEENAFANVAQDLQQIHVRISRQKPPEASRGWRYMGRRLDYLLCL